MSCCGGSCGCGSGCRCGNGCGGCKMAPDFSFFGEKSTETIVIGVVPMTRHIEEGFEMVSECDNGGCKCGPKCTCNPCTCK